MAINKKNTEDYFNSLRKVDSELNEAAGIKPELSFEDKLKSKLNESRGTTKKSLKESEELEEYNFARSGNYNYDDASGQFLEDDLELNDFGTEEDEFEGEEGGLDLDNLGLDNEESFDDLDLDLDNDIDEAIMEAMDILEDNPFAEEGDAAPAVDAPEAEVPAIDEPEMGGEDLSAIEGGEDLPPVEGGEDMSDLGGAPDLGSAPSMGAAPEIGGEAPATAPESIPSTSLSQPQDLDQMIQAMVTQNEEPVFESVDQLKDLGYEDLKDQDIVGKVNESVEVGNEAAEPTKLKDLFDEPATVGGAVASKKAVHKGKGKFKGAAKGVEYTDLGDNDINAPEASDADSRTKVSAELKFDKVVAENTQKSKALVQLAEKFVNLEDEAKNLKLENAKLMKVNSVLTLLPELHAKTREALVARFDECKSINEVNKLYATVTSTIKESKKPNINEAVSKTQGGVKYAGTSLFEGTQEEQGEDKEQARKNFLMGLGNEDQYFNC